MTISFGQVSCSKAASFSGSTARSQRLSGQIRATAAGDHRPHRRTAPGGGHQRRGGSGAGAEAPDLQAARLGLLRQPSNRLLKPSRQQLDVESQVTGRRFASLFRWGQ
jgi:hypothetical protein